MKTGNGEARATAALRRRELGLTIPPAILVSADEVIE
jgi:hypothetical protein